jgi:hypothetical protein
MSTTAQVVGIPDRRGEHADGTAKSRTPKASEHLVALAHERYTFGVDTGRLPFAVPRGGPYIARMLRGSNSLRAELADRYREVTGGRVATQSALADALVTLEGACLQADATDLHLRVAQEGSAMLLDLGGPDGKVVEITEHGWDVLHRSSNGPLFRRTALTGTLPEPVDGGDLEELRQLVNVTDRDWPLMLGWLVAALLPDIPHPIALLTGEQGTGKTTAGRLLVNLVDPSKAPLRSTPRDEQAWQVMANASWVVGLDNVSSISPWLSDAMCKAVTGDGYAARELYTNSDIVVMAFRRVLLLTSIDAGALRGDLAERLVTLELERIPSDRRRTDRQVAEDYADAHPRIMGALLDVVAEVLGALPLVRAEMTERPRMADFAEVLAALDKVRGTDSLDEYLRSAKRLSRDVVEGDPIGAAVLELLTYQDEWNGPASVLLAELGRASSSPGGKGWPGAPKALTARLKKLAPALRDAGVDINYGRSNGARFVTLTRRELG